MPNLKFLAQTVLQIWWGSKNWKSRSHDPLQTNFDRIFLFLSSVSLMTYMHAKIEVSSSNRFWDMEGSKIPRVDHFADQLWPNFSFLSSVSLMTYMHAKIEVSSSNRFWDMEGVQNSKSRSLCRPTLTKFFIFLSLVSLMTYMHAKIEVSSSSRFWDMEGVRNSKSRSLDPLPTALT